MMTVQSIIWLLAAFFTIVIAGPVPRRDLPPFYANTSTIAKPIFPKSSKGLGSVILSSSPPRSSSTGPTFRADTAVVVEPIQRTVYTNTQPAITYVDPEGKPMVTQSEEMILSTSFMPEATETITSEDTSDASLSTSSSDSSLETLPSSTESPAQPEATSDSTLPPATSSNSANTSGGTAIPTHSGYNGPQFTYIPSESEAASTSAASANSTEAQTTATAGQSTKDLTSDMTSCSGSNTEHHQQHNSFEAPTATASPTGIPSTSTATPIPQGSLTTSDESSLVVVTETQYTTVFPTTAAADQPVAPTTSANSPPVPSPSGIPTLTERPGASFSSPVAGLLPSTPLSPPPVVTGTPPASPPLPTSSTPITDSPSTALSIPPGQPSGTSPSTPSSPAPGSSGSPNAAPRPNPTSGFGGGFVYPTGTRQPAPETTLGTATPEAPTASALLPTSSTSDSETPSSTSDSPLIVTPIDPSQLFTITVTATTTEKAKETVTETATVTA